MNDKTKTILFATLATAMVLSITGVTLVDAVSSEQTKKQGKLIIRDNPEKSSFHSEMQELNTIVKSDEASETEKNIAKNRINEIKEITKTVNKIPKQKQDEIRSHINTLGPMMIELKNSGKFPIIAVGTDFENESLKIRLLKDGLTDTKIKQYEKEIRKIVGNTIDITIIPSNQAVFTGACVQTGDCDPLRGGAKITVENGLECSMGFKASYDGKTGFVTAGHCNSDDIGGTGEDVGNPSDSTSDKLGVVHANDFENNSYCDCMFVDASETISDRVFPNINPSATLFPVYNDWIAWEGIGSLGGSAQIKDTFETFTADLDGTDYTIQGAVEINSEFTLGDSGGTVYESGGTNKFAGIVSANEPDEDDVAYYIPYYRITNAFSGLTFTYT